MYSARNVFSHEPTAVAGVVVAIVNLAIAFGLNVTADQVAAINTALVLVLTFFYVRPTTASKAGIRELGEKTP